MKKLRQREIKWCAQGHSVPERQGQELNPNILALEPVFTTTSSNMGLG